MKMRTIAEKSMVAILMCGSVMAVRPAQAFVWPVSDISQIASFVTNINTGISEVTNTKSQIENALEMVNSIGDQATAISKYMADLTEYAAKIGDINLSLMKTDEDIKKTTDSVSEVTEQIKENNKSLASVTVDNVDSQIGSGATSEEVQETIAAAKSEAQNQTQEANASFDEAKKEIIDITDNVIEQLKEVKSYLDKTEDINAGERLVYKKEADELINQSENLKKEAQEIIRNAKTELNSTYTANIVKSFDEYAKSAEDYQSGRIGEESFKEAGEKLKQDIASNNIGISSEDINHLVNSARQIVNASKKLQEDILNSRSNSREYSDDEPEKLSFNLDIKYDFQYSSSHQGAYAAEIYFNEDLDEEYETFILPKELLCHKLKEKDLKDLEKHTTEFSECVTLAKAEKDYICPAKGIDEESEKCDPYQLEPKKLYLPYKEKGVYDHLKEDYSVANVQNNARNQQYADSWMRADGTKKSVYDELADQMEGAKIDTTRNGYELLGVVELEGPKLWSKIRVVDTLYRAKKATQQFDRGSSLYLDSREKSFVDAYKNKPGKMNVETLNGMVEQQVFSNVFLHHCGIKADDVSVDFKDKYDQEKTKSVEKNIAACLFKYAAAASGAKPDGAASYCGANVTVQQCMSQWNRIQQQAINDSNFQTLTLSTINNYQTAQDYAEERNITNIRTLEDTAKEAKTSRDGYAAGAQINYYETIQILGIVDADAQNLQTEILALLPDINYSYFYKGFDKE